MQVRGAPRDLQPGEPLCAPTSSVLAEAHVTLLRSLYRETAWRDCMNSIIYTRLGFIGRLHRATLGLDTQPQGRDQTETGPRKSDKTRTTSESDGMKSDRPTTKSDGKKARFGDKPAYPDSDSLKTRGQESQVDNSQRKSGDLKKGSLADEEVLRSEKEVPEGEKNTTVSRDTHKEKSVRDGKKEDDPKIKKTTTIQEKKDDSEEDKIKKASKDAKETGM